MTCDVIARMANANERRRRTTTKRMMMTMTMNLILSWSYVLVVDDASNDEDSTCWSDVSYCASAIVTVSVIGCHDDDGGDANTSRLMNRMNVMRWIASGAAVVDGDLLGSVNSNETEIDVDGDVVMCDRLRCACDWYAPLQCDLVGRSMSTWHHTTDECSSVLSSTACFLFVGVSTGC